MTQIEWILADIEARRMRRAQEDQAKQQTKNARALKKQIAAAERVSKWQSALPSHVSTNDPLYPAMGSSHSEVRTTSDAQLYKQYKEEYEQMCKEYGHISLQDFGTFSQWKETQKAIKDGALQTRGSRHVNEEARARLAARREEIRNQAQHRTVTPTSSISINPTSGEVYGFDASDYLRERQKRIGIGRIQALRQEHAAIKHNPTLSNNFFKGMSQDQLTALQLKMVNGHASPGMLRPITVFDIETDDYGRPVTVSALKFARDPTTGNFGLVDTFQRYYNVNHNRDLLQTSQVHGLSRGVLKRLRREQGATYANTYNESERAALESFLKGSVLSGHNISGFDISHLGIGYLKNGMVDTLDAARNMWPGEENSLDAVFKRLFGKTMEQAGLPHHDAMSDTIATSMILERLAFSKGKIGNEIRHVLYNEGRWYGPEDSYLGTGVYKSKSRTQEFVMALDELSKEQSQEIVNGIIEGTGNMHMDPGEKKHKSEGWGDFGPAKLIAEAIDHLETKIGAIQTGATNLGVLANSIATYKRGPWLQALSKVENGKMEDVSEALNIPSNEFSVFKTAAMEIKQQSEYKSAFNELRKYYRTGLGDTDFVKSFRRGLKDSWGDWGPTKVGALKRDQEYADEMEFHKRNSYLRQAIRKGSITEDQYDDLIKTKGSFEDLADATEKVIQENKRLTDVYNNFTTAMERVRWYNPNQYLESARSQMNGILGSARGVVPSFLLDPVSRIGNASFNYLDQKFTPLNRTLSVWNSGVGTAIGAGIGTAILPGAGTLAGVAIANGVGATASQIAGNVGQGKMEVIGYGIQNTLNTLGAVIDWISVPFKILSKTTKLLIGSFTGLSFKLNGFMANGLTSMTGLGNPLTSLTGIGYGAYQGTQMLDIAGLFSNGSMNSIYENFANQQKALYTTGEMNQNRLIAASMLGMFDQVYGPSTNVEAQYNGMANTLLSRMKTQTADQRQQTMYLASQIDSNLPGLLQTAQLLGVSDISQLTNPRNRGMYWNPIGDRESAKFRWDQYEFGAARSQLGVSKMRIADVLWNAVGKDLYNGLNIVVDKVANKDWDGALQTAGDMWDIFKGKVTGVWDTIKKSMADNGTSWINKGKNILLDLGDTALKIARGIITVWDNIVNIVLTKAQGLISYLSTVKIEPQWKDGHVSFNVKSIKDQLDDHKNSHTVGSVVSSRGYGRNYVSFVGDFDELTQQLFPGMDAELRARKTIGDIYNKLQMTASTWTDPEGNGNNPGFKVHGDYFTANTPEEIKNLIGFAAIGNDEYIALDAARHYLQNQFLRSSTNYSGEIPKLFSEYSGSLLSPILDPILNSAQGTLDSARRATLVIKVQDKEVGELSVDANGNIETNNVSAASWLQQLIVNGTRLETTLIKY